MFNIKHQPGVLRTDCYNKDNDKQMSTPDVRERQKQMIIQAVRHGRMGIRSISLSQEQAYLKQVKKEPRPVCLVLEGVPIELRGRCGIGIIEPKPLAAYKKNAVTSQLASDNDKQPDTLHTKALANLSALRRKMQEQNERKRWELYQPGTSGHLNEDGTFSLPKFKARDQNSASIPHNELLTVGYDKSQIVCYCIGSNDCRSVKEILANKREVETSLGLEVLPLVIYSPTSGTVQVWFEQELQGLHNRLTTYKEGPVEECMDSFCHSCSISREALQNTLNLLPWSLYVEALNTAPLVTPPGSASLEILQLLVQPYNEHDKTRRIEKLRELLKSGHLINDRVYYGVGEKKLYFTEVLVNSEFSRRFARGNLYHDHEYRESQASTDAAEQATNLFKELIRNGCPYPNIDLTINWDQFFLPNLFNLYMALDAVNPSGESMYQLFLLPEDNAGHIVAMDLRVQLRQNNKDRLMQNTLKDLLTHFLGVVPTEARLMSLFYYGADPMPLRQKLITKIKELKDSWPNSYLRKYGNLGPEECVERIVTLWKERENHPDYIGWPEKLSKARKEIDGLKQSLDLTTKKVDASETPEVDHETLSASHLRKRKFDASETPEVDHETLSANHLKKQKLADFDGSFAPGKNHTKTLPLQFLVDAFCKPPILNRIGDDDETILKIFQHYYRRPGPERVLSTLNRSSLPAIWKPVHSCCHALRARNNALWFMELLEQFNQRQFSEDEKNLLALAIIYHDAAAEDVSKQDEEQRSAYYFKRDLEGKFPQELLEKVARALEIKENDVHGKNQQGMDQQLRDFIRVLRNAARIDFPRCAEIGPDFPDFSNNTTSGFDPHRLDLPLELKEEFTADPARKTMFQRHFEAAMHGAVDLASVTGGYHSDLRKKGTYAARYQLHPDNGQLKQSFEQTPTPLVIMNRFVDDNVRRTIARMAGIHTCNDPNHGQCQSDTFRGVTRGIHNRWHDLEQVRVPAAMSLLEKMQCEYDFSLLSETTRQAINQEVQRLKKDGIAMNPGTLTQETMKSPDAIKVLDQIGISVVNEQRGRGYRETGVRRLQEMLVPVSLNIS